MDCESDLDVATSDEDEHQSGRSENSDTEQEITDNDSDAPDEDWVGKDGTIWNKEPPRSNVRYRTENIIRNRPGVNHHAKNKTNILAYWELFFTPHIQQIIVDYTNEHIQKRRETVNDENYKRFIMKDTNIVEIRAWIVLLYLVGLFRSNKQLTKDLWRDDGTGVEIFRKTMPLRRFHFLLSSLRFDDKPTRTERKKVDNLAPIRQLFQLFVAQCKNTYTPNEFPTIDEMLPAFRSRCKFRQYIPNKPSKYGIKIQALVDNTNYYSCYVIFVHNVY